MATIIRFDIVHSGKSGTVEYSERGKKKKVHVCFPDSTMQDLATECILKSRSFWSGIEELKNCGFDVLKDGKMNSDRPVYIHIPKTGGTYVRNVLSHITYVNHSKFVSGGYEWPEIKGYTNELVYKTELLDGHTVFATVRNIWDWLVSYWAHAGGHDPNYRDDQHYDRTIADQGFDYFVRAIADRGNTIWPNRGVIHFALWDSAGKFLPHYLLRADCLDQDLAVFNRS